jgi:molecular chaperone GrpE
MVHQPAEEREPAASLAKPEAGETTAEPEAAASLAGPEAGETTAELRERVAGLEDRLLRALADLENVRRRAAQQVERARAEERAAVAARWLPVLDNLDLAMEHADADPRSIVAGVRSVREQALEVLGRLGFPRRTDLGVRFDPARHEAVAAVPAAGDAPPGTVVDVVRPGYGDDAGQLRPAAVVVSKESDGGS